jgi:hypothetical protein
VRRLGAAFTAEACSAAGSSFYAAFGARVQKLEITICDLKILAEASFGR